MLRAAGVDPHFGTTLHSAFGRAGLVEVTAEGIVHCLPTAQLGHAFLPVLDQLGERIVGTGIVTDDQLDEVVTDMRRDEGGLVGYTPILVSARGRRPTPDRVAGSETRYGHRTMADTVEFTSNGQTASGYLALPTGGSGPGVIVVQEWWGLDSGIKEMADRLAVGGFVALAPDLYHGELAGHDEMDKASELMQAMPPGRAARDMSAAVDYLAGRDDATGDGIGVVGFCMGGMLSLILAANRGDKIKAAVPFYGYPQGESEPDWSGLTAAVHGHMAGNDDFFGPDGARALESKLRAMGKDVTLEVHPGTGHAFMGPHNALGTLDEKLAAALWPEVLSFLHSKLG